MKKKSILRWNLWAKLVFILTITYQLDQLYNGMYPSSQIPSPFKIAISALLLVFLFKVKLSNLFTKKIFKIGFIFVFWAFVTSFWAFNFRAGLSYSFQMLILISFSATTLYYLRIIPDSLEKLLFYSILVGGIISLLSIMGYFSSAETNNARMVFDGVGTNAIAISVGYIFVMGLAFLFWPNQSKFRKLTVAICMALMFIMLIRTGTRSVIWGIFLSFILSYIISIRIISLKKIVLFGLTIITLYFGVQSILSSENVSERLSDRLLIINESAVTENSRIFLWTNGLKWYNDNPAGSGAGTYNEAQSYVQTISLYREAHSVYVSTLIQMNIIGLLLLILFLIYIGKEVFKMPKGFFKLTLSILFIFFIMQTLKGSFLQTRLFWHPITVMLLIIEMHKSKNSKYTI